MRSTQFAPTKENLLKAFQDNLIGRNEQVYYFASTLNSIEGPYSFAINARWGDGKTFFVKQTQMLLDACNPLSDTLTGCEKASIKQDITKAMSGEKTLFDAFQPQMTVYYDAWACDNDVDPILSLVFEIEKASSSYLRANQEGGKEAFYKIAHLATSIVDAFMGLNTEGVVSNIQSLSEEKDDPFVDIKKHRDLYEIIRAFFEALPIERGNRLVIFIDELDRCKPDYAIRLLERVKHYLDIENVTFVFSVNADELCHTIKQFYGIGFDASRYLTRFFDYTINLSIGDLNLYFRSIGLYDNSYFFEMVCKAVIDYYKFSLRDLSQFYGKCHATAYKQTHNSNAFYSDAHTFGLYFLIPIMTGLALHDQTQFQRFIDGKDAKPLLDIMGTGDMSKDVLRGLLNSDETYNEKAEKYKHVSVADRLQEFYNAVFVESYDTVYRVNVGPIHCDKGSKKKILDVLNGHTTYADFS